MGFPGMDSQWNQEDWTLPTPPANLSMLIQPVQSQPRLHTIVSLAGEQDEVRKYTAKDWDAQRLEITRLYNENALKVVMKVMREQHGLDAT
jgi:hypothetical protein